MVRQLYEAGLVGPIMIIIIGLTAIGAFAFTDYSLGLATRMLRIPFMILSSKPGYLWVAMGMLILLDLCGKPGELWCTLYKAAVSIQEQGYKETVIKGKDLARTEIHLSLPPTNKDNLPRVRRESSKNEDEILDSLPNNGFGRVWGSGNRYYYGSA